MGAYVEIDGEVIQSIEITESEIENLRQICAPRNIVLLMDGETQSYCDGMEQESYQFLNMCLMSKTIGCCRGIPKRNAD